VAVLVGGTGWGRGFSGGLRRRRLVLLAGPVAVLLASQLALGAFCAAYPLDRDALRLNRPSDVLRGVVLLLALLIVPVGTDPPLPVVLDRLGAPLLRLWT
jgi:hypothetical protein